MKIRILVGLVSVVVGGFGVAAFSQSARGTGPSDTRIVVAPDPRAPPMTAPGKAITRDEEVRWLATQCAGAEVATVLSVSGTQGTNGITGETIEFTKTTLQTVEHVRGASPGATFVVEHPGGFGSGAGIRFSNSPEFTVGETVVIFRGTYGAGRPSACSGDMGVFHIAASGEIDRRSESLDSFKKLIQWF